MALAPSFASLQFVLKKFRPWLIALTLLACGQASAQTFITSFTPLSAVPGASITITGEGFSATASQNVVHIGGARTIVTSSTVGGGSGGDDSLTVTVPDGAQHGYVTVVNQSTNLRATSRLPFLPRFSPAVGRTPRPADFIPGVKDAAAGDAPVLAAGDFNNDGMPDVVTARFDPTNSNVYLRLSVAGTLDYTSPTSYTAAAGVSALDVGDIDGDGLLDIVALTNQNDSIAVLRNSGTATAPAFTTTLIPATDASTSIRLGDFDNDGRLDVAIGRSGGFVSVYRNITPAGTATITLDSPVTVVLANSASRLAVGDFNADGNQDIAVTASSSGATVVTILTGNGAMGFTRLSVTVPEKPWEAIPADVDGDGMLDLVLSFDEAASVEVGVLRNTSTAGAATSFTFGAIATVQGPTQGLAVGDLDGDGKPDVVVASASGTSPTTYAVYRNQSTSGSLAFDARVELESAGTSTPRNLLIADLDLDGKADILAAHYFGQLTQFRNVPIAAPVTQATNVVVSQTTLYSTSATISWTRGSGDRAVVFMKAGDTGSPAPVNLNAYSASSSFGSGDEAGSGWYAVGSGTGTSVNVTNLTSNTDYRVMVVEYNNNGLTGEEVYQTAAATGNPFNFETPTPVSVISLVRASTNPSAANTVNYTLTLGGNVYAGMTAARFSLSTSGVSGASIGTVTGSGSTWTIPVNTGTGSGTITLNLATATDIVPGIAGTLPVVGETYTIDRSAQALPTVTMASDNADPGAAYPGDTVTLSFTAAEDITPTVQIAGQAVTAINTGGFDWTADYTVTAGDPLGPISFEIAFVDSLGNAGTNVTTTTDASTVVVGVPSAPPPPVTLVSGMQSGVDLTGPLHIVANAVIDGGRLSGDIYNSGLITGTITLGPNTTIQGGTMSGTITGDPSSPAVLLGVTILPDTVLAHVIIGAGTVLPPDAVIGAGVRFESRNLIPPGLDLTGALQAFRWSGDSQLTVIDLGSDILRIPTRTILEALQLLATGQGNALDASADGELELNAQDSRGMLLPVRVRMAARGTVPGTYVDEDGNLVFVTAEGYEVLTYSVLLSDAFFDDVLAERSMSFEYDAQGRLVVTPDAHDRFRFFGKAAAAAVPAASGSAPGLQPRGTGYVLVFEDDDGVLMEQELVPVPADWPNLRAALAALPGVSDVTIDIDGTLAVEIDGQRVTGRMAHQAGVSIVNFLQGEAYLGWAGDLNGDGTGDYHVFYPRQSLVQVLYVNP